MLRTGCPPAGSDWLWSTVTAVPFPDEVRPVEVVGHQRRWPSEFATLAQELWQFELADRGAIEHIGSTSEPGLAGKDVIDIQIRDCLRQDSQLRDAWGGFKVALAESLADGDLLAYGRVKQPAWTVLMRAADAWAKQVDWEPEPIGDRPTTSHSLP